MIRVLLAGVPVEIRNLHPLIAQICKGYETDQPPKFVFEMTDADWAIARSWNLDTTDDYLEMNYLCYQTARILLQEGILFLHCSVIEVDGQGYAFTAQSGVGKSTQTRLWLEHFGDRARIINGDKPLMRLEDTPEGPRMFAYGTPWNGKEGMGCNAKTPLKALFFLRRGDTPSVSPISDAEAIDFLLHQFMYSTQNTQEMIQLFDLENLLLEHVPKYYLYANMTVDSVICAYEAANGTPE